jgi:HTH-type transcriptional regulator/antitoxin HigA
VNSSSKPLNIGHLCQWLLKRPESEAEYNRLVESRDELRGMMGSDELHPLEGLVSIIGDHIEAYDRAHRSMPI